MRERDTFLRAAKLKNQTDNRERILASALLVDANCNGLLHMLNHFVESKVLPPETVQFVICQQNNINILMDALQNMVRENERKDLRIFLGTATKPHHVDNLIEFCIKVLHGEKKMADIGEATKLLEQDIKDEASEPTIVLPGVTRKQ